MAEVVVAGAGVIGLTTAICLREAGHDVRVRTAAPPQDTTSRAAGAMWGGAFLEPMADVRRWAEVGLADFTRLADEPGSGVRIARGTLAATSTVEGPPEFLFPGVEVRRRDEAPAGYAAAFTAEVPLIDMPRHLDYLAQRFGGGIELGALASLEDAGAPVVVNCTGLGARDLAGDPELRPVRGQHVVVENPGVEDFFIEEPAPVWASWMAHGDVVVLGGVAQPDDWSLEPDPAVAEEIVARCARVEPRFATARVVEHRVGLRPARPAVRLEEERRSAVRVIHNYGHGGSGVALSWGCARDVAALV